MARILQVCNSAFYLSHFLIPLVRGLVEAGHEVECVCEGTDFNRAALGDDVRVHPFPLQRTASPLHFLFAIHRMRALVREGRYDCVDSHNRSASIVARVAAWLEHVPVNLYTAHGFYFHDGQGKAAYEATVALEGALARITDFTLSQSTADVDLMIRRHLVDPGKIEVIGNGIDTRRFSPRTGNRADLEHSLGLSGRRFRVVATGRLVRGKGFGDLLEAFAAFHAHDRDSELLIIGGIAPYDIEPYQAEFMARVEALGLTSAVTVTGLVKNVEEYLATSDAFVLPSYREGMPRALLEAMSMELPVLATNIRGCREIVRQGVDGELFEPHDVGALASLLDRFRKDAEARTTVGRRARERVCQAFDERDYVARQVAAISRLLGQSRPRRRPARPGSSFEATP